MNALVSPPESPVPAGPGTPLLRSLALCDLVDSTGLVQRLGDQRAAALLRRHDRMARDLMLHHQGQEIDKTDGFLVLFERPIQATAFALAYQRELQRLGEAEKISLQARVGVHVGDVMVWHNDPGDVVHGAKPLEVEGLVKPVTARLASLALPGQILVSGVAASLAQRAHAELGANADRTRWINHGRYRFKGVPEPVVVYEVGEAGIAPLRLPPYSGKAWREVPWWRRPGSMFIEAGVAAAAILLGLWLLLRPPAAIAFAERDWVVVGDIDNLTTQPSLDDTLRVAFRIGLEQSRYVNVVSDLQVRETLRRMELDPTQVKVDRRRAAEIALREGAKAAILPLATEVGGKLRITAEVIDPATETTVYTESAEGVGVESALSSIDTINEALRQRLGENLAAINANTQPLAKVTTANVDALRAYSLARRAMTNEAWSEALALYRQAIALDGDFALAHVGIAGIYLSASDRASALPALRRAQALRDKLPAREALYVDAIAASLDKPAAMFERWSVLAKLYPDYYAAHANHALMLRTYANRYADAIAAIRPAISPHNHRLGSSQYLLGALYLASDDYARAAEHLGLARQLRGDGMGLVHVELLAAERNFVQAAAALAQSRDSGVAGNDVFRWRVRVLLAADQGQYDEALRLADEAVTAASAAGPLYQRAFEGMRASLLVFGQAPAAADKLRAFARTELAAARNAEDLDRNNAIETSLFAAYLAARSGAVELAESILGEIGALADASEYPNTTNLAAIARAEVQRARGNADRAVALLRPFASDTGLYLTRVALRDAYAAAGQPAEALEQALWLSQHRGRAYAEDSLLQVLSLLNVLESTQSLLAAAEYSHALQRGADVQKYLSAFERAWPAPPAQALLTRMAALRAAP
jgi:putative peptide modification system cyclase